MRDADPSCRRLLVIDPCEACRSLMPGLRSAGWQVECAVLDQAESRDCDVGLIPIGPDTLRDREHLKQLLGSSSAEWIAVLSPEVVSMPEVADFVGEWCFDYHTLPFDVSRFHVTLGRAYGMVRLRARKSCKLQDDNDELLGESSSVDDLRKLISKLAPTQSPVLIRGESGTGKELVARTLHRQSSRADKPFIAINCGAIPEHLIQSELFGHEKGAFTGAHQRKIGRIEAADNGTLFLDEIGDLPLEMQANLLRFLQEMQIERVGSTHPIKVDVRVLAATHIDLELAVRGGSFREDLYYRLNVLQVHTAPLRDRLSDVQFLASHFVNLYSQEIGRKPKRFSEDALRAMVAYAWPGNVRELANRVRRGLVLAEGRQIERVDLGLDKVELIDVNLNTLEHYKMQAECRALQHAMAVYPENMTLAARGLGISRPTFYRLLHKHQIR
ncbi:Fis family transcriptional regulator [Pseudomonas marincola]|uniref:Fis family transcriptional regulator n=1 Tax=Pseudomonas marincola TaxID=437900 RepID=A0A653E2B3_9PSED|nr:sigma-54 dependent transcriptional regulator [Pseudomonas marincola]CAE6954853.1 Fis family transcriptional regulator [Pseudomonas marincola]